LPVGALSGGKTRKLFRVNELDPIRACSNRDQGVIRACTQYGQTVPGRKGENVKNIVLPSKSVKSTLLGRGQKKFSFSY
jgi:vancomycin resistance protein YoaR